MHSARLLVSLIIFFIVIEETFNKFRSTLLILIPVNVAA